MMPLIALALHNRNVWGICNIKLPSSDLISSFNLPLVISATQRPISLHRKVSLCRIMAIGVTILTREQEFADCQF